MSTIVYGILSESGLVALRGEPVEIENNAGMTFGIHCNARKRPDDEQRFVVTNIETGMRAGWGATRDAAIATARQRVRDAIKRGTLARTLEAGIKTRDEILTRRDNAVMEGAA
ncbi:hypothetical protein [Burkholderia multivorans]|uniref:hypothetical protein n=1 Tax=Burkholderia multivorans TaxID=87883 RepID=UPI0015900640|nr:hypothetical protein [Burkholderia multivorans]MBU9523259.1 hypothetical protein [Burkholderia multivorans]